MGRILLIDDEPTYCQHLAFLLAGVGHLVRAEVNGHRGLLAGFEFLPDLLIADWALGGRYSGSEIAAELRRINSRLRTLLITGHPEISASSASQSWIVDEVIVKPFNRACILAAVDRLISPGGPYADVP